MRRSVLVAFPLFLLGLLTVGCGGSTPGISTPMPLAPPHLEAQADHENFQALLSWKGATGPIVGYRVYRGIPTGAINIKYDVIATLGREANSYIDAGLEEDVFYYYYVTALADDRTESERSNVGVVRVRSFAEISGSIRIRIYGNYAPMRSASARFVDTNGKTYDAEITMNTSQTSASFKVYVPPGTYRVDRIVAVEGFTGFTHSSSFPDWERTVSLGGYARGDFVFVVSP